MKRFEPVTKYIGTGDYIAEMEVDPNGDYVLHSDYADLERQLAEALMDAAALRAEIDEYEDARTAADQQASEQVKP